LQQKYATPGAINITESSGLLTIHGRSVSWLVCFGAVVQSECDRWLARLGKGAPLSARTDDPSGPATSSRAGGRVGSP